MNREIKFRAWDESTKEMRYPEDSRHDTIKVASAHILKHHDNVMQWTGLYDCTKWESLTELERENFMAQGKSASEWNGKEIYEGDVVTLFTDSLCEVVFKKGGFGYMYYGEFQPFSNHNHFEKLMKYITVKGNIDENPELLNP